MEAIHTGHTVVKRSVGIAFGFATQVLFLFTVWHLFWFLRDGSSALQGWNWIVTDSFLKDRRLERFVGAEYKRYESEVPGFPLVPFGPLARRKTGGGEQRRPRLLDRVDVSGRGSGKAA